MTLGAVSTDSHLAVPRGPADLEALWERATPLDGRTLPAWLDWRDRDCYRLAGTIVCDTDSAPARREYLSLVERLATAGLVTDSGEDDEWRRRVYVAYPSDEVWAIGIYRGSSPLSLHASPSGDRPVLTRDDVSDAAALFVADPFLFPYAGTWFMFFEVLNWTSGKGEIAVATSTDLEAWTYGGIVLTEDHHLSYPHVFTDGAAVYMTPESHQAGAVVLYQAVDFPCSWEPVGALVEDDYLVDPTPFRSDGRWWMLVEGEREMRHDTLRLFSSEDLRRGWVEYAASPVVVGDAASARPAGRVIDHDGRLLRFAQDCTESYGRQVHAFEVDVTQDRTWRVPVTTVVGPTGAGWNGEGMHHVDAWRLGPSSWVGSVDGRRSVRREAE